MKISTSLLQRIVTAIILIPLILFGLFTASMPLFVLIMGLICLLAAWEWTRLMLLSQSGKIIYLVGFSALMLACYNMRKLEIFSWYNQIFFFALIVLFWIVAAGMIYQYAKTAALKIFNTLLYAFIGVLLIFPFWLGFFIIRLMPHGAWWMLFLLVLIWAADSGAYFVGMHFGTTKLAPKVSPGKTTAGVWGAMATALIVALIAALIIKASLIQSFYLILMSLITVGFSIVGDLFISVLKRQRHIKDTGTLLPGHGGLLDRIDSLLAATPIFTLGLLLLR